MRILVLVDGEHYPPVVRAAIDQLPQLFPGSAVVAAALLGGTEKLRGATPDYGVPLVTGLSPIDTLDRALAEFGPELVFDMGDEPVVDSRTRGELASRTLLAGVPYVGADFSFTPPPRPVVATKPSVAVVGTGKRTGKTAVSAHIARLLRAAGTPPVVVAMGRGGPPEPELVDPTSFDLTPAALVALADRGRHAASDHFEDAVVAGVATVGTRRCGGGMAGAPVDSTFARGVEMANCRPEDILLLEGSGSAIPPVHADATITVVPATADPEVVTGYLGPYRLLLADLIVVTMAEKSLAGSGLSAIEHGIRRLATGAAESRRIVHTVFRPFPLEPISGSRVFYATTAPASATDLLAEHLEAEHGAIVVGRSSQLANRPQLAEDLKAAGSADTLVVELKAAAIDLATRIALERGLRVVFCDNRVVTVDGGATSFDDEVLAVCEQARHRFTTFPRENREP